MSGTDAALLERLQETFRLEGVVYPTIRRLERATLTHKSSYAAELITLHLSGDAELRVFLKDFGSSTRVKEGWLGAGDMADRRWREVRVYRDLLATSALGTPRYHGVVWDEARQWFWLLLEYVEGDVLSLLDFEHWLEAARWLGRMQGVFAGIDLSDASFLVDHEPAFFSTVAEVALRATQGASSQLGARLRSALSGYRDLFSVMGADRSTFVHGAYLPRNIIVRRRRGCPLCVVDWEESARGSALYDLAFLADGFDRDQPRLDALIDGYQQEAAAAGLTIADRREVRHLLYAFCIHWNLKTLTKAESRNLPIKGISELVTRVEELAGRMS